METTFTSQAAFTKPLFETLVAKEWLAGAPEIHECLLADPPARLADVACDQGCSSIEIARGYPEVRVDGIDSDRASIPRAREHLAGSGVEDRVEFHERDRPSLPSGLGNPGRPASTFTRCGEMPRRLAMSVAMTNSVLESISIPETLAVPVEVNQPHS